MKPPPLLYKYEPFSARTLQNLKSQIIFFGSPRKFNDSFDCSVMPGIEPLTDEQVERLRAMELKKGMPPEIRAHFERLSSPALRVAFISSAQEVLTKTMKEIGDKRGVTCFSETNDNLLMWSHYTDKSQGFCLEFDTTMEPFSKVTKVSYEKKIPSLNMEAFSGPDPLPEVMKLYCTKSSDWAYEREWRVVHSEQNKEYHYQTKCLTGVYFGAEMPNAVREVMCLVLQGQNENVRFYQGRRSETEFKVHFDSITYVSHLEAKKRGLR